MAEQHFDFHYVKTPTGSISGQSVLKQTEDAINEVGEFSYQASVNAAEAVQKANQAVDTANTANNTASSALTQVNAAVEKVNTLEVQVGEIAEQVEEANSKSDQAVSTANSALSTAQEALSTANTALSNSEQAVTTANGANTTANNANSTAQDALEIAEEAKTTAESAVVDTDSAVEEMTTLLNQATQQATNATQQAQNAAASAASAASAAQSAVDDATEMLNAVVAYIPQNLTEQQQTQARENIGVITLTNDGTQIVTSPDYNTLTNPGFYHCNSIGQENGPGGANKLIVFSEERNEGVGNLYVTQVAFPIYNTNKTCPAIRCTNAYGDWSDWFKLLLADSNETINAARINLNSGISSIRIPNFSKGTTPSTTLFGHLDFYDANTFESYDVNRVGIVQTRQGNDGSSTMQLVAIKNAANSTSDAILQVGFDSNGEAFAQAPQTAADAIANEISVASFTREYGGSNYGVGGGLNTSPSGSVLFGSSDLNNWDQSGFYSISLKDAVNSPTGNSSVAGIMLALMRRWEAGTSGMQIIPNGNAFYFRTKSNTTWNEWYELAKRNSFDTFTSGDHYVANQNENLGQTPNSILWTSVLFSGKTKTDLLGSVGFRSGTDGTKRSVLSCNNPDGSNSKASIWVGYDANGNIDSYAPTPNNGDNSSNIANTSWAIGKTGNRNALAGYEDLQSQSTALTVNATTQDSCCVTGAVQITVSNGSSGTAWTKTVGITNASATVSLGSSWDWVNGESPTISANGVLVLHWCGTFGVANFVSTTA